MFLFQSVMNGEPKMSTRREQLIEAATPDGVNNETEREIYSNRSEQFKKIVNTLFWNNANGCTEEMIKFLRSNRNKKNKNILTTDLDMSLNYCHPDDVEKLDGFQGFCKSFAKDGISAKFRRTVKADGTIKAKVYLDFTNIKKEAVERVFLKKAESKLASNY